MKTTLNLDDGRLADAKALAARQRISLMRLIEGGLHLRLRWHPASGQPVRPNAAGAERPRRIGRRGRSFEQQGGSRRARRVTPDVNVLVVLMANDLPDAWLAAAVLQCGVHLVSFDRDFRRLLGRSHVTLLPLASTR